MARIPEAEIERIKKEVSLLDLVKSKGIELKKHGADFIGLCPFHNDKNPSFVVTPATNLWHCLGACNTGGSVIDFLMRSENISFRHAVEKLSGGADKTGLSLAAETYDPNQHGALLNYVTEFYHKTFYHDPAAAEYLAKRGIRGEEVVKTFKIGYANRTLTYVIPDKFRQDLQEIGIFRTSGHEHFAGSVVIPILDENGSTTEIYGRKVTRNLRPGTPLHLYLPGQHKGVWNRQACKASKEIILCEALIDALTFWAHGFRNVTASYGIAGFTPDHLAAFKQYGTEKVWIAYDNDEAGNKAAETLSKRLAGEGIETYRINLPKDMDVNEFALKVENPGQTFGELVDQAALMQTSAGGIKAPVGVPSPAPTGITVQVKQEQVTMEIEDRIFRIRGLSKNTAPDVMRVNLKISFLDKFFVDTLDLYSAKQRGQFVNGAIQETGLSEEILRLDLAKVLLKLEELQEKQIAEKLNIKETYQMTPQEEKEALAALKDPGLVAQILKDFETCGTVGEETNKLIGYLAAVSRKLDDPLAVLIMSRSAAGKSSLQDAILSFVPEEDKVRYTAITGQSLFYLEENALVHKVLAIAEDEGAERATYAIKTMQSDKNLTIASTGKDPISGKMRTQEYKVKGPIAIMLTTTAAEVDYETANRFLILTVDEEREQTRQIHDKQRENETLAGILKKVEADRIIQRQQNMQRLLKPLLVVNPYAQHLTFLSDRLRTRRDHKKYLSLIRAIAFLHQHQRKIKTVEHQGQRLEYIEAALEDIDLANRLANEILGHSLDEMAPATRRLLSLIFTMVGERVKKDGVSWEEVTFSRKEIRETTCWSDTQLKRHLKQLEDLEYLYLKSGGHKGQKFVYELLYRGEGGEGEKFLLGLLDIAQLKKKISQLRRNLSNKSGHLSLCSPAPVQDMSNPEKEPLPLEKQEVVET